MQVDRESVFAGVADERRRIADLIDGLDEAQLATPSLCAGWDVKTVAAHLVSVFADNFWAFQRMAVRRGGIHRAIDTLARHRAQLPALSDRCHPPRARRLSSEPAAHRTTIGSDRHLGA